MRITCASRHMPLKLAPDLDLSVARAVWLPPTERTSCASLPRVRQKLSPESKAVVVAEIRRLCERNEESVVTLRTKDPSLVYGLSDHSLTLLGAKDFAQARNPDVKEKRVSWLPGFLANLRSCLVEGDDCAFPGFKIDNNTTGNSAGITKGRRFTGEYIKGLQLRMGA